MLNGNLHLLLHTVNMETHHLHAQFIVLVFPGRVILLVFRFKKGKKQKKVQNNNCNNKKQPHQQPIHSLPEFGYLNLSQLPSETELSCFLCIKKASWEDILLSFARARIHCIKKQLKSTIFADTLTTEKDSALW